MSITKIILLTILLNLFICDAVNTSAEKSKTTSWTFLRLRSNNTEQCRYINDDFDKLEGYWYYVLRSVTTKNPSRYYCGHLSVSKTSKGGFESTLNYLNGDQHVEIPMTGQFVNNTIIEIPEMKNVLAENSEWKYPFIAQMGICNNDSIIIIEPVHYFGGVLVFTRDAPENMNALKVRFGTYDELNGKERTVLVAVECNKRT